jgi:hypothetical protein
VFKLKLNPGGKILNHKARLDARGFLQKEDFDYTEVFSPIAKHKTIRLVIVVTTSKVWPMYHLYVKSAFLNGTLEEIVYVFTGVFGKQDMCLPYLVELQGFDVFSW